MPEAQDPQPLDPRDIQEVLLPREIPVPLHEKHETMWLHRVPGGQVLEFRSDEAARRHGENLRAMGDGCRFYMVFEDTEVPTDVAREALRDVKEKRKRFGGTPDRIKIEIPLTDRDLMAWAGKEGIEGRRRLAVTVASKVAQAICRMIDQSLPEDLSIACFQGDDGQVRLDIQGRRPGS